jgi:YD repeat-containing protein
MVAESWGGVDPGSTGSSLRHSERIYDSDYGVAVIEEHAQSNRFDQEAENLIISASWDTGLGALTSLTDENGQTTFATYDRLGRQTSLYRSLCQEPQIVYQYIYEPGGALHHTRTLINEICDTEGNPNSSVLTTDPFDNLVTGTGVEETYAFVDGMRRIRATISEGDSGDGFGWILSDVVDYDARGNVERSYDPIPLPVGSDPLASVRVGGISSPFAATSYDAFGREVWSSTLDGVDATITLYGARLIQTWDGNDIDGPEDHLATPTTTVFDGQGREVLLISQVDSDPGETVRMVRTSYDVLDNIIAIRRGDGTVTEEDFAGAEFASDRFTARLVLYDSLGRLTHNLDADSGTTHYYYDRLEQLTRVVDARGEAICFLYDTAGRLVAEDLGCNGTSWVTPDSESGHSSDDDATFGRLSELTEELWDYMPDSDGDFLPESGADVLYGFDHEYESESESCLASPSETQRYLNGRLAWRRDHAGCFWASFDERGRGEWVARQLDPDSFVFVSSVSFNTALGPDDRDMIRSETLPDGTSLNYSYSNRGLIEQITGDAPSSSWLFYGRTFVDEVRYNETGSRVSMIVGDAGGNQAESTYMYDARRRLRRLRTHLNPGTVYERTLADFEYEYDAVSNITGITDHRTIAGTSGWAPEPVSYSYAYNPLYHLTRATPSYASGGRPTGEGERPGEQTWNHDQLGSMAEWTAIEDVAGEHFMQWSLGTIVNGQQLIEAEADTGVSERCDALDEASARVSGPAPHALYFAYKKTPEDPESYEGAEACYDAAGNMVALFRLELTGCDSDPLDESVADWTCTGQIVGVAPFPDGAS